MPSWSPPRLDLDRAQHRCSRDHHQNVSEAERDLQGDAAGKPSRTPRFRSPLSSATSKSSARPHSLRVDTRIILWTPSRRFLSPRWIDRTDHYHLKEELQASGAAGARQHCGRHCFDCRPRTADVNQACMEGAPPLPELLSFSRACRVIHEIPASVRSGRRAPSHRFLLSRSTSRRAAASSASEARTDSLSYHPAANPMDRQNRISACEPAPSRDCDVSVCQHH
jgi:hypothetical protein